MCVCNELASGSPTGRHACFWSAAGSYESSERVYIFLSKLSHLLIVPSASHRYHYQYDALIKLKQSEASRRYLAAAAVQVASSESEP